MKLNDKLRNYILAPTISEAAYMGNIGFAEMVKFYDVATIKEKDDMEKIIKSGDWDKFKNLIFKVTGRKLK